jgi:hypothetical protein
MKTLTVVEGSCCFTEAPVLLDTVFFTTFTDAEEISGKHFQLFTAYNSTTGDNTPSMTKYVTDEVSHGNPIDF